MITRWSDPMFGDPSIVSLLTVGAYFLTMIIALIIYFSSAKLFVDNEYTKQKKFWLIVIFTMLALGIERYFNFGALLLSESREYAYDKQVYGQHRYIQKIVIISFVIFSSTVSLLFINNIKSILKTNWLAILSLCFLVSYVIIRGISLHKVDFIIRKSVLGIKLNWVLELGSIAVIACTGIYLLTNMMYKKTND